MRLLVVILIIAALGGYMYHDKQVKQEAAAAAVAAAEEAKEREAAEKKAAAAKRAQTSLQGSSLVAPPGNSLSGPKSQPGRGGQNQNTAPKPMTNVGTDLRKQWGWDTASPLDPPKPGSHGH